MRKYFLSSAIVFALLTTASVSASPTIGTLQSSAYVWGENLGWLNLKPDHGGLIITDSAVSGYAWSRQFGWINFSPSQSGQGVTNTSSGLLGGMAWVSGRGWLDMNGATIDVDGHFRGIAGQVGTPVGRVSFDCAACTAVTDWRPSAIRQAHEPSNASSVPASIPPATTETVIPGLPTSSTTPSPVPTPTPRSVPRAQVLVPGPKKPVSHNYKAYTNQDSSGFINAYNEPLTLTPDQSGSLTRELADGTAVHVDIVSGALASQFTIDVKPVPIDFRGYDVKIIPIGDFFFDINAYNNAGNVIHRFSAPLKITLPVVSNIEARRDFGVYWYDEATGDWNRMPAAAFSATSVIFYTDHLNRFAILNAPGNPEHIFLQPSLLRNFLLFGLPGLVLLAGLALHWGIKKPKRRPTPTKSANSIKRKKYEHS